MSKSYYCTSTLDNTQQSRWETLEFIQRKKITGLYNTHQTAILVKFVIQEFTSSKNIIIVIIIINIIVININILSFYIIITVVKNKSVYATSIEKRTNSGMYDPCNISRCRNATNEFSHTEKRSVYYLRSVDDTDDTSCNE